ncbi:Kup system potassium uptake protein [Desulfurella amilsii]|uniref:Kup system potassium uptake protein n=1 Tax=Desulfurella amilsii TaxID=1562698 RepID=A0A1X4XXJ8_9BACT|nr:KUP/HAK/KT family potassium transporter [Desulfurella amilsii]OSS42244.1 Kup system potassium uptake protein [Desulfurella amilsii]
MLNSSLEKLKSTTKAMGLVFGDIGTSPIYTLAVVFILTKPTHENIMGVVSLVLWTLILLVSVEYVWLAMSISKRGEGGTTVLKEVLAPTLKSTRAVAFVTVLSYVGISFLMGDGVITPAISILSAVEGLTLVPKFSQLSNGVLLLIASIITIGLFVLQKKGTEKVASYFGPIMIIWFISLGISGLFSIFHYPQVLKAINPYYAIDFFIRDGFKGFVVLSDVILCATGGEALYADMGHLGKKPIVRAWYFVFSVLILSYLGQAAYAVTHHSKSSSVLFSMVFSQTSIFYIPFLILSILATIIASQAMISGVFSIVYQGIATHIFPMLKIDHTSDKLRSQIYINFVNWLLMFAVLYAMWHFQTSDNLAAAYGFAVNGTMLITAVFLIWIFHKKNLKIKMIASAFVFIITSFYFASNLYYKIPHGAYLTLFIAMIPLTVILIFTQGQKRLYKSLKSMDMKDFLLAYKESYANKPKLNGVAVFFTRNIQKVPPYIENTMLDNGIIYETNIFVTQKTSSHPFGVVYAFGEDLAKGLKILEIKAGYMEIVNIGKIFEDAKIKPTVMFYGVEDIITENIIWKIFALIKKVSPNFIKFHRLPSNKVHGVIVQVKM